MSKFQIFSLLFLAGASFAIGQTNLSQFADCIGPNTLSFGSTCTLPSGTYTINPSGSYTSTTGPTLVVSRSNINITGGGVWPSSSPTLVRGSANGGTPYVLLDLGTAQNVNVSNIKIDGARFDSLGGSYPLKCDSTATWDDVYALNSQNVTFSQMEFKNAPGRALRLGPGTSTSTPLSYVYQSTFSKNRSAGVNTGGSNNWVRLNYFEYTGASAVEVHDADVTVDYNDLYMNHIEYPYNNPGGQLIIYHDWAHDGDRAKVTSNIINGNNSSCASTPCTTAEGCWIDQYQVHSSYENSGIEHYGDDAVFTNNEVLNHTGWGIYITYSHNLTHVGNDGAYTKYSIHDNALSGYWIRYEPSPFGYPTGSYSFTDLRSVGNGRYGVEIPSPTSSISTSWGSGACLVSNSFGAYSLDTGLTTPSSTSYGC